MSTICVYGAASDNISEEYDRLVFEMCKALGEEGHDLIFGGGATGLMGAAARGFTAAGREIIGVFPTFMDEFEPRYQGCTKVQFTETLSDRKEYMEKYADAFVIVPGGIGTFDEFFQILTLKELGQLGNKPILIFNALGYYNKLREMMDYADRAGFFRPVVQGSYAVCDTREKILEEMRKQLA